MITIVTSYTSLYEGTRSEGARHRGLRTTMT